MVQVQSLAVEPATIEIINWRSSKYKHWVNGFIIDGDYWLVKVNKRTFMKTEEYVWNEIIPPFPVPVGEGIPTLINPSNPFYIWEEKPEQWHPCWLRWKGTELTIVDMVTGKTIGYGIPAPISGMAFSCRDKVPWYIWVKDEWHRFREMSVSLFADLGLDVVDLSLPTKAQILGEVSRCHYWSADAHGDSYGFEIEGDGEKVLATEIKEILKDREPYIFSFVGHCGALDMTGVDTWAEVLTKNKPGCIVAGWREVKANPNLWQYTLSWREAFFNFIRVGYSIPNAFEESVVNHPEIAPIVAMYEGLAGVEVEGVGYIWWEGQPIWHLIKPTNNIWPSGIKLIIAFVIVNDNDFDVNVTISMFRWSAVHILPAHRRSELWYTLGPLSPGIYQTDLVIRATRT